MSKAGESTTAWPPPWNQLSKLKEHKEELLSDNFAPERRPPYKFCTDSKYDGEWNCFDEMDGKGHYTFPHNAGFHGTFKDGQFDKGVYFFPMGQEVDGFEEHNYVRLRDGMLYIDKSKYCTKSDRRYWPTIIGGFKPAGHERVTGAARDRPIPKGCYDTGDGFFDPYLKCVVSAVDPSVVLRIPTKAEEDWIISNCRKAWDEPVGYRPDLYEKWTTGTSDDLDDDAVSLVASLRTDTDLHNLNDGSSFSKGSYLESDDS